MKTALIQAWQLIISLNDQLLQIIQVTLRMSLSSSLVALLIGVPLGVFLATAVFRGKQIFIVLNRTMMSLPPVVCGLICYMLFSGVGPLRHLHLLFTVKGMIIAQVILITPLVIGNVETFLTGITRQIRETCIGLGLSRMRQYLLVMNECKYQIVSTYLFAFSRALAEVGAVSMVGGAIAYKTNVMTTAIMNYTNMGNFVMGVSLGIILLSLSLILNVATYFLQRSVQS